MFYRITGVLLVLVSMLLACQPGKELLTYSDSVAPIIHEKCSPCHVNNEAAPFELLNVEDITRRHKLIRYLITKRIMPPWPADPTYSHFANELYMSDEEIATVIAWMDQGMLPGDTSVRYTSNELRNNYDLGKPDMIVKVPPVLIPGNNTDLFLVMKIPLELSQDTFIRAIEFIAGNKKLVHHVNTHLVCFEEGKKETLQEGKVWVNQDQANSQQLHKDLGLLHDDGTYPLMTPSVSNYLPGSLFSAYPGNIGGYRISKKSAFYLNDFHYGPSPVDATDSSYYKIYFDDKPPQREVKEFQMGTLGISPVVPELIIPANAVKSFQIKAVIPEDISLLTLIPHMHLIGKEFLAYAVKPSGDTIPLIRINNWDFRWQYFYQCRSLIYLPRGTTIYVHGVFDNTVHNPNNPFDPPQEIRDREGSMRTTDEMFQFIVTYVPYQKGDEKIQMER